MSGMVFEPSGMVHELSGMVHAISGLMHAMSGTTRHESNYACTEWNDAASRCCSSSNEVYAPRSRPQLGGGRSLEIPQPAEVTPGELGLQLRSQPLVGGAHLAQVLVRQDRHRPVPPRRDELHLAPRRLRDDERLGQVLEVRRRHVERVAPPLV